MPKVFTSETQKIGEIGENIAVRFLVKHSFSILDRNYTRKWGEIDIVAEKDNKLYFIEVKSVSYETEKDLENFQPEENVNFFKRQRLSRVIQTYLIEKDVSYETDFQVDVAAVFVNSKTGECKIRITENIIL